MDRTNFTFVAFGSSPPQNVACTKFCSIRNLVQNQLADEIRGLLSTQRLLRSKLQKMADGFEMIRIDAAGTPGQHGSMNYASRNRQADYGSSGAHGQSATRSTPGTSARDVHIELQYDARCPQNVQVLGKGTWSGKDYSARSDQV